MQRNQSISVFETLESRRLLSASAQMVDGQLDITGTEAKDSIIVSLHRHDATKLDVRLNEQTSTFNLADITKVQIDALGGNDKVVVNEKNGPIYLSMVVNGGEGNDSIVTGSGDDIIDGGDGNDKVSGGAGDDQITGGEGNDKLSGGDDNDTIDAGDGRDKLVGGTGDDNLDGGAGSDSIQPGKGADSVAVDATNPHEVKDRNSAKEDGRYVVTALGDVSTQLMDVAAQAVPGAVVFRVEKTGDNYTLCYHFGSDPQDYRAVVSVADDGNVDLVSREVSLDEARPSAAAAFAQLHPNIGLVSVNQQPQGLFTIRYRDEQGQVQEIQTNDLCWGVDDAAEDADNDGYYDPHPGEPGQNGDQNSNGDQNTNGDSNEPPGGNNPPAQVTAVFQL